MNRWGVHAEGMKAFLKKKYLHSRTLFYQKWPPCGTLSMSCHTVIIWNDIGWIVVFLLFLNANFDLLKHYFRWWVVCFVDIDGMVHNLELFYNKNKY